MEIQLTVTKKPAGPAAKLRKDKGITSILVVCRT